MGNYELESDEVILFKDVVTHNKIKGRLQLTLTSRKIILEKEKGIVKKEKILMDIINLEDIKIYNEKVQVKQKGPEVTIQTIKDNIIISFDGMFKANKFIGKIVDTVTGTTFTKRSTEKIKGAFNTVDDVFISENVLHIVYKKGKNNLGELIDYFKEHKISYNSIFSERPTLNDVFLELTGKGLRD